jgi:hypothetical protein
MPKPPCPAPSQYRIDPEGRKPTIRMLALDDYFSCLPVDIMQCMQGNSGKMHAFALHYDKRDLGGAPSKDWLAAAVSRMMRLS